MATVADLLTWVAYRDTLKGYMEIDVSDTSEDVKLQLWLETMVEQADLFLWRDDFTTLPSSIKVAIFAAVEVFFDRKGSDGLVEVQTSAIKQKYEARSAYVADSALQASKALMVPFMKDRLLNGA